MPKLGEHLKVQRPNTHFKYMSLDASCSRCGWSATVSRCPDACPACGNKDISCS